MQIKGFPTHLGQLLVADDFVPPKLQRALTELSRQPIWSYGWRSNTRRERYSCWQAHVPGGDGEIRANCEAKLASKSGYSAIHALFKLLQAGPLQGLEPLRVYLIECASLIEQQTSLARLREFFCLALECPGSVPEVVTGALRKVLAHRAQRRLDSVALAIGELVPVFQTSQP